MFQYSVDVRCKFTCKQTESSQNMNLTTAVHLLNVLDKINKELLAAIIIVVSNSEFHNGDKVLCKLGQKVMIVYCLL